MWPFTRCKKPSLRAILASLHESNSALARDIRKELAMLSSNVKNLVDQVTAMKSVVQSSNVAWAGVADIVASQRQQITDLQTKLANGTLSAEDIQAVDQSAQDVHDLAAQMQAAVPANTPAETPQGSDQNPSPATPPTGDVSGEQ